jgi:hypothetical protein
VVTGPWGGYSNGRIPLSAMVQVEGSYFKPDVARRVIWALSECRRQGVNVTITEGYRAIGIPADQYDRTPATTSDGTTNQWYQIGRRNRGLTPSAAVPGHSNHGWAEAGDFAWPRSTRNNAIVRDVFKRAGLLFTIASEWWHADASGVVTANLASTLLPNKKPKRRSSMTTMYYTTKNDKPKPDEPPNVDAIYLAGDGQGDAAWILAPRHAVAQGWAIPHGAGVHLLKAELPAIRDAYLSGAVKIGTVTVDPDPALLAELQKITAEAYATPKPVIAELKGIPGF